MKHLLVDTCDWIDLGRNHPELREKLFDLIDQGEVLIVLPDLVVTEWERHKNSKIVSSKREQFRTFISHTKKVVEFLSENQRTSFLEAIQSIPEETVELYSEEDVREVDDLFASDKVVRISLSDSVKVQAAEQALENKAPFKKKKNSMADALILFSFLEFLEENEVKDGGFFVSRNTADFGGGGGVHRDLAPLLEQQNVTYFANIGHALNEIEDGIASQEEINRVEQSHYFELLKEQLESLGQLSLPSLEAISNAMAIQPSFAAFESIRESLPMHVVGDEYLEQMNTFALESARVQEALAGLTANTVLSESTLDMLHDMSAQMQDMVGLSAPFLEQMRANNKMITNLMGEFPQINLSDISAIEGLSEMALQHAKLQETIGALSITNVLPELPLSTINLPKIDPAILNMADEMNRLAQMFTASLPKNLGYLVPESEVSDEEEDDEGGQEAPHIEE